MKLIMENWRIYLQERIADQTIPQVFGRGSPTSPKSNYSKLTGPKEKDKIMSQVAKQLDLFMKEDQAGRRVLASYYNQVGPGKKYKDNDDALAAYKKDNNIAPDSDRVFADHAPKHKDWVESIHNQYQWVWSKLDPRDGQGGASWHNLSILIQHADSDPSFQEFYRDEILKKYHPKNGENKEPYEDRWKYISDRISCARDGTQKYGTQGRGPERFKKCGPGT